MIKLEILKERQKILIEYTNKILNVIENKDQFSRGDMEGIIMCAINSAIYDFEIITKKAE